MTVSYRAVLRLDDREDAIRSVNQQFRSWLAERTRDQRNTVAVADWDGPGEHFIGPDSTLTVVQHHGEDGSTRQLLQLVEKNKVGIWTTRVFAATLPSSNDYQQVAWVESEGKRLDGSHVAAGTPRVVRNLIGSVNAFNGALPLLPEPTRTGAEDISTLLAYITDDHRTASVIIASPIPDVSTEMWARVITTLDRDCLGCASFFVLEPGVLELLNESLGQTHFVPPGSIRTFVPSVDLEDREDAKRHRILGARTMNDELVEVRGEPRFTERLIRLVSVSPRIHLLEAQKPSELLRTERLLQREQLRKVRESLNVPNVQHPVASVTEVPKAPAEVSPTPWMPKLIDFVRRLTGRERVDEAAIDDARAAFERIADSGRTVGAQIDFLQGDKERLEDEVAALRQQLDEEEYEREFAEELRRDAEHKVRALEHWRSTRTDKYTFVDVPAADWESAPTSVADIVSRLTGDPGYDEVTHYVELTDPEGAINRADRVDEVDRNGAYASHFWEYVLVLRDYVIACTEKGYGGNVHMYLTGNEVDGRKCPAQRHKSNESETVRSSPDRRRERTFRVPSNVDPSEEIFMTTHFAPTHRDQNAPRLYYCSDVTNTGKIYIGYIGTHLTNLHTN